MNLIADKVNPFCVSSGIERNFLLAALISAFAVDIDS